MKFPLQDQSLHEFNISTPDNDDGDDDDDDDDGHGDGDDDKDDDQYLHESNISIILHHFSFLLPFLYWLFHLSLQEFRTNFIMILHD